MRPFRNYLGRQLSSLGDLFLHNEVNVANEVRVHAGTIDLSQNPCTL